MPEINYLYHLIQTSAPPVWGTGDDDYRPANFQHVANGVYSHASKPGDSPPEVLSRPEMAGATLIGTWDRYGASVTHDEAAYLIIRPLGNYPPRYDEQGNETSRAGRATGPLRYANFGVAQRKLSNGAGEMAYYPSDNQPFAIDVRHKYFGGNANPAWDSWGWRAEMLGVSSSRDPTSYAIGIYSDPDCTAYLYTTGAFSEQPSEWQVDEQGLPIPNQVWATEYNPGLLGQPSETPQDIHHAVLLGSAQEGRATLPGGPEPRAVAHLYWKASQPPRNGNQEMATRKWTKAQLIEYILGNGLGKNLDQDELQSFTKQQLLDVID